MKPFWNRKTLHQQDPQNILKKIEKQKILVSKAYNEEVFLQRKAIAITRKMEELVVMRNGISEDFETISGRLLRKENELKKIRKEAAKNKVKLHHLLYELTFQLAIFHDENHQLMQDKEESTFEFNIYIEEDRQFLMDMIKHLNIDVLPSAAPKIIINLNQEFTNYLQKKEASAQRELYQRRNRGMTFAHAQSAHEEYTSFLNSLEEQRVYQVDRKEALNNLKAKLKSGLTKDAVIGLYVVTPTLNTDPTKCTVHYYDDKKQILSIDVNLYELEKTLKDNTGEGKRFKRGIIMPDIEPDKPFESAKSSTRKGT